jgi:hypothetical protein
MMRNKKSSVVMLFILALCGSLNLAGARGSIQVDADEIAISVATDKAMYDYGEPIQIAITAQNITDHPVTLSWPTTCQSRYAINGGWHSTACLEVLTSLTIGVGQSYTWTRSHPETPAPGFYIVVGQVIDYGNSEPRAFAVGKQIFLPIVAR